MKECIDCYYARPAGDGMYKCSAHNKFGKFDPFVAACSSFASDDVEGSCDLCTYYESGGYKWNKTGRCAIKGIKVSGDAPSCPRYVED
ncbi:hypothetical protein [Butyribacter intestini]|uniref:hypothetical protein n=1 Tax=Butyribacter intestini TaxID=1703332 RepID=UPI003AF021A8